MEGTGQDNLSGEEKNVKDSAGGNFSVNAVTSGNITLQDSEFTVDSTGGNTHTEESNGWFGGMGADFRNIAHCLTDNVGPVVSGVAHIVHRTAVAVANEIAQLEQDGDAESLDRMNCGETTKSSEQIRFATTAKVDNKSQSLMLPWEIRNETCKGDKDSIPVYLTDDLLMEDVLALSNKESTFLKPFRADDKDKDSLSIEESSYQAATMVRYSQESVAVFSSTFAMDERRIKLIQRLMDIDKNLASMHSRFSGTLLLQGVKNIDCTNQMFRLRCDRLILSPIPGKSNVKEEVFWKNYFYHCEEIRNERLGWNHDAHRSTATSSQKLAGMVETIAGNSDMRRPLDRVVSSLADDDEGDNESLVPAESASEADDSSYVIASAPNSVNTYTTSRSVDDLVVISAPLDSRGKS